MNRHSFLSSLLWLPAACCLIACPPPVVDDPFELPDNPPVAEDDSASATSGAEVDIDVLDNDFDPEDDDLEVESTTQPPNGEVTISASGNRVEYVSDDGFVGTDEFEYVVTDGNGNTDSATVSVDVSAAPTLVLLTPEDGAILEGGTLTVTWEVTGCEVSGPSSNSEGCHLHRYLDGEGYSDADSGTGWYARFDFDLLDVADGPHELLLRLHKNDGSDGPWEPETLDSIEFCMETCDPPK